MIAVIWVCFVVFSGLALAWWMFRWQHRVAERSLRRWAVAHQVEVVQIERANSPYSGPNAAHAADRRIIYRVWLKRPDGRTVTATATMGSKSSGILDPCIAVDMDRSEASTEVPVAAADVATAATAHDCHAGE